MQTISHTAKCKKLGYGESDPEVPRTPPHSSGEAAKLAVTPYQTPSPHNSTATSYTPPPPPHDLPSSLGAGVIAAVGIRFHISKVFLGGVDEFAISNVSDK